MKSSKKYVIVAFVTLALVGCMGVAAFVARVGAALSRQPGDDGLPQGQLVFDPGVRVTILQHSHGVVNLVKAGAGHALFAEFDRGMAAAVPENELQRLLSGHLSQGPIGACLGESVRTLGRGAIYRSAYAWNGAQLSIVVCFDPRWKIVGLLLDPDHQLPVDPMASYQTKGAYRLPFDGAWSVLWGGDTYAQNDHIVAPDQRHAYDILVARNTGTHTGDGSRNEEYYDWGKSIAAPADATVVEAVDGIVDNKPGVMNTDQPFGNHVVLDCRNGEYVVMAHFKEHSVRVHAGDWVKAGQVVAECGNSGNSSEPHLHIHLQDSPHLYHATGLPLSFTRLTIDGKPVERAELVQGEIVSDSNGH